MIMPTSSGPLRPAAGPGRVLHVTPEAAGWENLEFAVVDVDRDNPWSDSADGRETAIVPQSGAGVVSVDGQRFELARSSVFEQ